MPRKLTGYMLAACITIVPGLAQTTTELLQKGIFAQETEGNLDSAILIYRQIVNSAPSQRDLAAQAQFRLGQALLQKGDLTSASQEFDKLARDYSEYRNLVSSLSAQSSQKRRLAVAETSAFLGGPPAVAALREMAFEENKPVRVTGRITAIQMLNPAGAIIVEDDQTSRYIFLTASAAAMIKQGFSKATLKPGDRVEVTGVLTVSGQMVERAMPARADLITVDGKTVFDRSTLQVVTTSQTDKQRLKLKLDEVVRAMVQVTTDLNTMRSQYTDGSPQVQDQMKRLAIMQVQVAELKKEIDEGK